MISFLFGHLVESTLVCLLLVALACCFRNSANARYAVLVLAAAKFAIPSMLLAKTGAKTRRLEIILDNRVSTRLLYIPRILIAGLAVLITLFPIAGGYCQQCVSNLQQSPQTSLTEKK